MSSTWKYKLLVSIFGILFAIYLLIPSLMGIKDMKAEAKKSGKSLPWYINLLSEKELNLGLDLRGGLYMELDVGIQEALRHQIDFISSDIRRLILDDKFKDSVIEQIPGNRLRIEINKGQFNSFDKEIVRVFGNNVFNFENKKQEIYFKVVGDPLQARKKAFDIAQEFQGFDGKIDLIGNDKYLAISMTNNDKLKVILDLLSKNEYDAYFVDANGEVQNVAYLSFQDQYVSYMKRNIIEQAANSVRNRIDRFGVAEASVSQQSSERLVVELPGIKDPDRIIDIIKRTGKLEFRLVNESLKTVQLQNLVNTKKEELKIDKVYLGSNPKKINDALKGDLPPETEIAFELRRDPKTKKVVKATPHLLEIKAEVTGDMLDNASVQTQNNLPYVSMSFNKTGAKKFGDLTSKNVGRNLAIVLDGIVTSAPVIKGPITGGQAQIELGYGRYDELQREATELVLILKEGALPASLQVATKNIIGPSLGHDSIKAGLNSLLIAAAVILLFMLIYYKVGGLIANIALAVNVLFIFAILTLFQASLTLPGIAGIVLTLGMAVDANVIIFERMREEKYLGEKPGLIVDSGYNHAQSAIIDGNLTTFISGLVLFEFGTGPIKGFATTLMIGIVTTLITALGLTRLMYDWLVYSVKVKEIKV